MVLQANMAPITREFQFVDVNSVGSRKQARSHVMRQYLREKRKQQNVRLETSLHTPNSSAFTPLQWQKRDHSENPHALDELRLDLYDHRTIYICKTPDSKLEDQSRPARHPNLTMNSPQPGWPQLPQKTQYFAIDGFRYQARRLL